MRWGSGLASVALTPNQEIFISLAGPFSGFLLAAFAIMGTLVVGGSVTMGTLLLVLPVPVNVVLPFGVAVLNSFVLNLLWVNIFWGIFNLVPVYPLDGGHVTRYVLLKADPLNGVRKSLWVSVIAGISFALIGFFLLCSTYMAILFAFLAFQSYQTLQSSVGGY
jgi:Zn-dependent protease